MLKNAQIGQWCYMHIFQNGNPFTKDFLVIRKTALLVEFCVRLLRFCLQLMHQSFPAVPILFKNVKTRSKILLVCKPLPHKPLSRGSHVESQENKKLCFSLQGLDVQNVLFLC